MADVVRPLSEIAAGTSVFLDSTIFIYHFTGASPSCRSLLSQCEAGRLHALTSAVAIAEVTHRLMTIEAVARGLVSPGNVIKKLRERPELVWGKHVRRRIPQRADTARQPELKSPIGQPSSLLLTT